MGSLMYKLLSSSSLLTLGVYHLICSTLNFMKTPQSYSAKLYHPFPRFVPSSASSSSSLSSSSSSNDHRFKHIPLCAILISLLLAFFHQIFVSFDSVNWFFDLQSAAIVFIFLLIAVSLPFLSADLSFGVSSAVFFLHFSAAASARTSDLQSECDSVSGRISAFCSILCFILACQPRIFVAEVALAAAICLQGLWQLQTGLFLQVDAFIPDGCHGQLNAISRLESSIIKCDLEEARLRAVAILDLLFIVYVMFVVVIVFVTNAIVAKILGLKRLTTYEPMPTNSADSDHIQKKTLTGTQA